MRSAASGEPGSHCAGVAFGRWAVIGSFCGEIQGGYSPLFTQFLTTCAWGLVFLGCEPKLSKDEDSQTRCEIKMAFRL